MLLLVAVAALRCKEICKQQYAAFCKEICCCFLQGRMLLLAARNFLLLGHMLVLQMLLRLLQVLLILLRILLQLLLIVMQVVLLLILLILRKRIVLVVALFHEAGKSLVDMPLLLIQPLWTFLILAIFLAYWVIIQAHIATLGQSTAGGFSLD